MRFKVEQLFPFNDKSIFEDNKILTMAVTHTQILRSKLIYQNLYPDLEDEEYIERWKAHQERLGDKIISDSNGVITYKRNIKGYYAEFNTLEEFVDFIKRNGYFEFDGDTLTFID